MTYSNTRLPKPLAPKTVRYESALLIRILLLSLFVLFLFIFICVSLLFGVNRFQEAYQANMTSVAISVSTANMALTQTAIPTKTLTLTPTITQTPTTTFTPTITFTPTATPVIAWSKSIVDSSNNRPGPFLSLGFGSTGKYYVAYFRDGLDELMVVEGNGKSWKPVKNLSQINREGKTVGLYVTLDISNDNFPYLSYLIRDKGLGKAGHLTSAGTWNLVTVGQNLEIYDLRNRLDSTGISHFVYLTTSGDVWYRSSATNLEKIVSRALPPNSLTVVYNYFPLAFALDSLQRPYVCFSESGELQCKYKLEESWELIDSPGKGIYPSLDIDEGGSLHLVFYDYQARVLKYAFLSDPSSLWEVETVDLTTNAGWYPSLMVDPNKVVHISYYDAGATSLKYAVGKFGGWDIYTVDNDGDVGLISSLVIDLQNNPGIAYFDSDRRRIYFVTGNKK